MLFITNSGIPDLFEAITALPNAIASYTVFGELSTQDGTNATFDFFNSSITTDLFENL